MAEKFSLKLKNQQSISSYMNSTKMLSLIKLYQQLTTKEVAFARAISAHNNIVSWTERFDFSCFPITAKTLNADLGKQKAFCFFCDKDTCLQ